MYYERFFPRGEWHEFLSAIIILSICLWIEILDSQKVSKAESLLFFILFASFTPISIYILPEHIFDDYIC